MSIGTIVPGSGQFIPAGGTGKPGKVQGLGEYNSDALILDGRKFDARIDGSMTSAGIERTIDGVSALTITVEDPERFLLAGGYYERRADLKIDQLWFRLSTMNKTADSFELGFIDREVALLQRHTRPRKASRANMTRAEFLRMLVREEPTIGFQCPELHKRQPIHGLDQADQKSLRDSRRARQIADGGISSSTGAKLKVQGAAADRGQVKLMNRVLNVCESLGAGERPTLAAICSNIGETGYSNADRNSIGAFGLYQLLPSTAKTTGLDPQDVEACTNWFLTKGFYGLGGAVKIARANKDWPPGKIANAVQGAYADLNQGGAYYDKYLAEAKAILDAYGGVADSPTSDNTQYYVQRYEFSRGQPGGPREEDTWACGTRLADEVDWRWFIVAGVVYLISDYDLIRSRPRMVINENTPGVDQIDFELDTNKGVPDQVTITCRAGRWEAPPGTVVVLDETMGDAAGAWVVSDITRQDLFDPATVVTATRPQPPQAEPAPTVASRNTTASTTADGGIDAGQLPGGGKDPKPPQLDVPGPTAGPPYDPAIRLLLQVAVIAERDFNLDVHEFGDAAGIPAKYGPVHKVHAPDSLHYSGHAFDASGPEQAMHDFAAWVQRHYLSLILELIHNPGFAVKNGKKVDGASFYAAVWAGHKDHVHLGM